MRKSTDQTGLPWKIFQHLEDLDFADDICLLSEKKEHVQTKLNKVSQTAAMVGLKVNYNKTKILAINSERPISISLNNNQIEQVKAFNYLGSTVTETGGSEEDIKTRIGKAYGAFATLGNIWRSREISEKPKIRLFNSNILSVLLYGCESWRVTKTNTSKLQVFINKCLRKILKVYWPDKISNEELWKRTDAKNVETTIKERKWKWIGHNLRKKDGSISKEILDWNPQGTRKRG